jgi:hypothetical protein
MLNKFLSWNKLSVLWCDIVKEEAFFHQFPLNQPKRGLRASALWWCWWCRPLVVRPCKSILEKHNNRLEFSFGFLHFWPFYYTPYYVERRDRQWNKANDSDNNDNREGRFEFRLNVRIAFLATHSHQIYKCTVGPPFHPIASCARHFWGGPESEWRSFTCNLSSELIFRTLSHLISERFDDKICWQLWVISIELLGESTCPAQWPLLPFQFSSRYRFARCGGGVWFQMNNIIFCRILLIFRSQITIMFQGFFVDSQM